MRNALTFIFLLIAYAGLGLAMTTTLVGIWKGGMVDQVHFITSTVCIPMCGVGVVGGVLTGHARELFRFLVRRT